MKVWDQASRAGFHTFMQVQSCVKFCASSDLCSIMLSLNMIKIRPVGLESMYFCFNFIVVNSLESVGIIILLYKMHIVPGHA